MTLLTYKDVQRILGVGKDWLIQRVQSGEIPHIKLGRYTRFELGDIEAFLLKHKSSIGSLTSESEKKRKLRSRNSQEDLWQK